MTVEQAQSALRDRRRGAVQDQVASTALELFLDKGYDATTVEQIARAAGLSPRSFFRYFAGKDDVMGHMFARTGAGIADALDRRPAGEAPWTALRRAFDGLIEVLSTSDQSVAVMRLIYETPPLFTSHLHKQARWSEALADVLLPRLPADLGPDARRLHAGALAAAAVSCLEVARAEWIAGRSGKPLADLVDRAMDAVAGLDRR